MNTRGSAYVFVLVLTLGILLALTVAATVTSYEAEVSRAYQRHSNLSLLAYSGVERAVRDINAELYAFRAQLTEAAMARMDEDGEFIPLFAEEAGLLMTTRFSGSEIVYGLELSGDSYTVTVNITPAGGGFGLVSTAMKAGIETGEQVTASVKLASDATAEVYESGHRAVIVTGDIEYRIEKLNQNR